MILEKELQDKINKLEKENKILNETIKNYSKENKDLNNTKGNEGKKENKNKDKNDSEEIEKNTETKDDKIDDELLKKLIMNNEKINKIINFLEDNRTEIEMQKGHDELKKLITEFKNHFYPYKNIRRFAIPVIGCISSGKSTILNYLLKLQKTLQMADTITTKCVCIIRHKKGCKKARIYNVVIEERGKYIYNFEKGDEIVENVDKVIEEKNKDIKENKVGADYKKYFLIIEYEIPFFRGDFEKYAELFEFMDIPGLNESSEITNNQQNNSIEDNFYFKKIFPLIQNNIKFSLFIFAADTYDKENSLQILTNYIKGGSQIKNEENKNNMNQNINKSDASTKSEEIKNNASEEEKKRILFCQNKSFKESIFILNKIDKFQDKKEEGKTYFRDFIAKHKFDINLNDNNQPCIMGRKLNDEIIKLKSFKDYVSFYIIYSNENCRIRFYNYISKIMNQDFKVNIKNEENDEKEEEEEEEEKEEEEAPSIMKKQDYENYIQLKKDAKQKSHFLDFLKAKQYYDLKEVFEKNKDKYQIKKEEDDVLEKMIKLKMEKILEEFFDIGLYEEMTVKIISDFNIDTSKKNKQLIKLRLENLKKSNQGIGNPKQLIIDFLKYIEKIEQLQVKKNTDNDSKENEDNINNNEVFDEKEENIDYEEVKKTEEFIENKNEDKNPVKSEGTISILKKNYEEITNYFNNTSAIRFLLVGPHNSGKSSLLNNIIGYDQKILPTDLKETTKTGIIIKYIKKGETPKLFKCLLFKKIIFEFIFSPSAIG